MKNLALFVLVTFLIASYSNEKEELESSLKNTIEIYIRSKLETGTLDSVIIMGIETVTPYITTRFYQGKLYSELYKQQMISNPEVQARYKMTIQKDTTVQESWDYAEYRKMVMAEYTEVDRAEAKEKYEKLLVRIDSCQKILDSPDVDKETFMHYLVIVKAFTSKPGTPQKTEILSFKISQDFKIIE